MRFYFLPATANHGRATVCVESHDDGHTDNIVFAAGITYSSPKDQFCRTLGRQKAQGRLRQGLHDKGWMGPAPNGTHFFSAGVPYYDPDRSRVGTERERSSEDRFLDLLKVHVDSFTPAAVAKENEEAGIGLNIKGLG